MPQQCLFSGGLQWPRELQYYHNNQGLLHRWEEIYSSRSWGMLSFNSFILCACFECILESILEFLQSRRDSFSPPKPFQVTATLHQSVCMCCMWYILILTQYIQGSFKLMGRVVSFFVTSTKNAHFPAVDLVQMLRNICFITWLAWNS